MRLTAGPLAELRPLQVHQLYKLRVDVFVHEQQCPYAEIDDTDAAPTTIHICAWSGEELLGTARLFPVDSGWQFGRFALVRQARGTGVAGAIMDRALELGAGHDMLLDAQVPLVAYYERYGFRPVGERFDDAGTPHQPMRRATVRA
ncbi:GNAT family N-acetyltransferase [Corynebacterium sp.]|uniref:GNAT family N-acetyltransferase n=1 Tax=Corynebacterium sp. TaxID=1720 RepID=UPI0026DED902|nr:GNAT family N-acetyltransferase [Corynebacterium sp.]MDO5511703.1 GNAT family N-acetyltransferase [Corynebacterium sp.]